MTRALLIGYGKMGKLLAHFAPQYNITISAVVDHSSEHGYQNLVQEAVDACDIAFDFAKSEGITSRIEMVAKAKKPMIVGTTGWEKSFDDAKAIVSKHGASLLCAPNFSLGIALFLRLAGNAARLFSQFSEYDVGMIEQHHRKKQDAPSGTAKAMAREVMNAYPHRELVCHASENSALSPSAIHLSAHRVGSIPGTHELIFDSAEDTISLSHTARSREGFARGALIAAGWLQGKTGWYTLDDLITDKLNGKAL